MTAFAAARTTPGWFTPDDCRLEDFRAVVETTTDLADYPHADEVRENVLVYGAGLRDHVQTPKERREVQAELARALADGPGIVVFAGAFPDTGVVDRATAVFEALIAEQKAAGVVGGDHFATPGANDRVWGALDKFAVRDPEAFAAYYGNDVLALVSQAWLGPGYQVTSQVNVVNPGGRAQVAHRDYHLGFMSEEQALAFPAHVQRLSPVLIWGPAFLGQGEAAPPAVARGAASGPLMPAVTSASVVDAWSCSYARVGTAGRVVRRERSRWSDGRAWPRSGLLTERLRVRSSRCRQRLGDHQRTFVFSSSLNSVLVRG